MPWHSCWQLCAIIGIVSMSVSLSGAEPTNTTPATPDKTEPREQRVTVAVARDRAKLMHQVYASTLEVMHDRYFHDERAIVPARALEDVFVEMGKQSKIKARWISVNTKPMSLHHEPKSDFEKQAATEIAAGKGEFELIEKGLYLRAAPIPLTSGCISCHTGFFAGPPKTPRFAGLVISVPIEEE